LTEAAEAVAAAIAAAVPDDGKLLWADALLPREGRRPGSFEYQGENAFGLDFLTAVFSAEITNSLFIAPQIRTALQKLPPPTCGSSRSMVRCWIAAAPVQGMC
jgi:hypothetical protein